MAGYYERVLPLFHMIYCNSGGEVSVHCWSSDLYLVDEVHLFGQLLHFRHCGCGEAGLQAVQKDSRWSLYNSGVGKLF